MDCDKNASPENQYSHIQICRKNGKKTGSLSDFRLLRMITTCSLPTERHIDIL